MMAAIVASDLKKPDPILSEEQQLAALGMCMRDAKFYFRVENILKPDYFTNTIVAALYQYVGQHYKNTSSPCVTPVLQGLIGQYQSDSNTAKIYKKMAADAEGESAPWNKQNLNQLIAEQHKFMLIKGAAFELGKAYDKGDIEKIVEVSSNIAELKDMRTTGVHSDEEAIASLTEKEKKWREAMRARVPFISAILDNDFMLIPGITVVGGVTKAGKSTVVANLVPAILMAKPDKKVFIISNEDDDYKVSARIACAMQHVDVRDYLVFPEKIEPTKLTSIQQNMGWVAQRVKVVSIADYDVTNKETVEELFTEAAESGLYAALMLDYYQIVANSKNRQHRTTIEVSKAFGLWLKEFGMRLQIPLIIFAQLKPLPEDVNPEGAFAQRIQGDLWLCNHAMVGLEIVKGSTDSGPSTEIYCRLSRHGDKVGKIGTFKFMGGKLEYTRS